MVSAKGHSVGSSNPVECCQTRQCSQTGQMSLFSEAVQMSWPCQDAGCLVN